MLKLGEQFKSLIQELIRGEEVVLYEGSSNTSIILSETILNFKKVIIYYNDGSRKSSMVIDGNGSWAIQMAHSGRFGSPTYYALRVKGGVFTVSGKSITISNTGANYTIDLKTNGTFQFFDSITSWYITKVVGYR